MGEGLCSGAAWRDMPERSVRGRRSINAFVIGATETSSINCSNVAYVQPLLDEAYIPSPRGRPRKRGRWLLADKGYDAEVLRCYCDRYRMQPVIPLCSMKRKPRPDLPRLFDRPKYRQRNIIERMFGWLKENRRIVTRFDKVAKNFAAMVSLACAMRCLRHYFSYRA
ncbi:putative ISPst8-like transposase [Pseudomonas chlororaphis O6]|uniref:ISPst8-like transposase n=1 Tax=Pseudomonas chlororaphis O6 TaxID=1037915 RepID=A0AB33X0C3_9PSED|nr:putative ISPst8-like transposase [Pseudomonas chlororaphis O6]